MTIHQTIKYIMDLIYKLDSGWSAEVYKALQQILLLVFEAVDELLAPSLVVHF